jgi:phosphoglycerate dehydrogenase-like enzyme
MSPVDFPLDSTIVPFALPFRPRRIVVGAAIHAEIVSYIQARRPELTVHGAPVAEVTQADVDDADAYIGFRRPPQATTMGRVQWVHSTGAGVDGWLMGAPLATSILVTRSPELFGGQISEWAIARIFAIQQDLLALDRAQREHRWYQHDVPRVAGTRALLLGTGDIGRTIAAALTALGVQCTGVSRSGRSDHPGFAAVHTLDALPSLVAGADWIICSLPDTAETRGLVGRALLSRCRGAALLNCGRGSVVDESVIPEALAAGWLRAAALDVFEVEPLPAGSPLWDHERVIISPHMSGLTTVEGAAQGFLACLEALEGGAVPRWAIDRRRGY